MDLHRLERADAGRAGAKPAAISRGPITTSYLAPDAPFPLVIQPAVPGVDLVEWAKQSVELVTGELERHGALLFRGFEMKSVPEFEAFAGALCPALFGEYNDLPREAGKIYGTTPYPEDKAILFHNESSHMHRWPMKQLFFCIQPSLTGGRTPILDCREAYREVDRAIVEKVEQRGLKYVRNFCEDIDVPWQTFFHTSDKAEVEEFCRAAGMELTWKRFNGLRVSQRCPGVVKHPYTGEKLFFNQVQLHHVSCLDAKVRASLQKLFKTEDLPRNVYYGDGSEITDAEMAEIDRAYWKIAKSFDWQPRDLVMVDNMLIAHARLPYTGPRKIVVAMGEIMREKDLPS